MRQFAFGCVVLLLFSGNSRAEWLEASSDHFVIYGDQGEKEIRNFAERLERFNAGMSLLLRKPSNKPSPSNRVTIYVVSSEASVRATLNRGDRYVAGVYLPRAGSTVALVPKLRGARTDTDLSGATVLYHEYAHHIMWNATDRTYPRWFNEGFAEYYASVRFKSDGSIAFGVPATHRALELAYARDVPIRRLLDVGGGEGDKRKGFDSFYGQSWALFHYLQSDPARAGQLPKYEQLLATGDTALEAAEGAFGDLDKLADDVDAYVGRRKMTGLVVNGQAFSIGPIAVRKLRAGEAEMMTVAVESNAGVSREEAVALLPEARRVAALHPDDPVVLAALAEAEFDAGNDDEAIAAADKALVIDPREINAHIQRGYALTRKVKDGRLPRAAWKDVRSQWVRANKVENDHPVPLVQFYLSFIDQGQDPPKPAVDGLEWAMQLAPFDPSLRLLVANQMISDDRYVEAAQVLTPLAYSPHRSDHTESALRLLKEVEAKMGGTPQGTDTAADAD